MGAFRAPPRTSLRSCSHGAEPIGMYGEHRWTTARPGEPASAQAPGGWLLCRNHDRGNDPARAALDAHELASCPRSGVVRRRGGILLLREVRLACARVEKAGSPSETAF